MLEAIVHGTLLSFGLIIPLGAQNVFVFNQGASHSRLSGALPVILTASLCDTLLISLAVLGVSLAVLTLGWLKTLLYSVGLLFLLYVGWSVWKSDPSHEKGSAERMSVKRQISFAASVSLLNPHAILDTVGVIGTGSLHYAGAAKWAFSLACITVSWAWFFGLAVAGRMLGRLDRTGRWLRLANKLSALIIWGVAAYLAWNVTQTLQE